MERHREGRVLPAVLPSNIMVDLPPSGQPAAPYSAVPWGNPSGMCPIISSFYFYCYHYPSTTMIGHY